ncbi:Hypothetical predicted protein [Paramuricea clavata]|uniref:Uncharacterized protein n=1 Tax=Paramuricea clavata TaxID=317549 RepID=A0A6S7GQ77_PARCT|nr:Hypothetical predicted protein [Paramuricea clavata]
MDTLMQYSANDPEIHKLKDSLKHLNQYIKSDYKLRMVHQDVARSDAIDSLGEESTLITQDFAKKFLPAQYRETQAEFFGKRGISWHLTVCQSNKGGEIVP